MAKLNFVFSVHLWAAIESISVMRMLAEQAEKNLLLAVKEADEPGTVKEHEHEEETYDMRGHRHLVKRSYYSCGSSIGYDYEEVKSEHKHLITQLTRRSAFLTMFGLFEHRMGGCLEFMIFLTDYKHEFKNKGAIEKVHTILEKAVGVKDVPDVDHLVIMRNIMIHNDGIANDYKNILNQESKRTHSQNRLLRAMGRTKNATVNEFNSVLMGDNFLMYVVSEFNRYITDMETAVKIYSEKASS